MGGWMQVGRWIRMGRLMVGGWMMYTQVSEKVVSCTEKQLYRDIYIDHIYHRDDLDCRSATQLQYVAETQDHQLEKQHSQDKRSPNGGGGTHFNAD